MRSKALLIFLILALSAVMLVSCQDKKENTKDPQTTDEQTTQVPEKPLVPRDTVLVANPNWGYTAMSVSTSDPTIVSATLKDGGNVEVVSYNPGTAEVYVHDCFDHKAIIEITVADDENCTISYKANPCVEEYIDAADFGVLPNTSDKKPTDVTKQLQSAIDYAYNHGGGTVYLYPGIYKVDFLHIRDNVTLEMYSGYTDATKGFTDELAKAVREGTVTVLQGTRIMNNKLQAYGRTGSSNFTIRGGVLDNDGSTRTILLFGHAKNVVVENVIIKDIKNDHMIQVTGCEDVEIKNCIFAGFEWGGTFTREVIQVEPSTPGAHGSAATAPQRFEEGEFICPKNVTIDHCYFGPSDERPGPHIAIGHHSSAQEANCENFKITNNVFDRCSYSAIRFANIVNAEITGNKFIATADTNKLCTENNPSLIILFSYTSACTYNNIVDGRKITKALAEEKSGSHNLNISNNEFLVEKGSDKKIITVEGTSYTPGAIYKTGILRQDVYNSTPYSLTGYFKVTNFIGNLSFSDNKVTYEGQPQFGDSVFSFKNVYGIAFDNNQIELKDCRFTQADNNTKGLNVENCFNGEDAQTYRVTMYKSSCYVQIPNADGSFVNLCAPKTYPTTFIASEGGRIEITSTTEGNIIVKVIANDGYKFTGWKNGSTAFNESGDYTIRTSLKLIAQFAKN